ncbi:MAG: hypothetical protein OXG35_20270 [Acidobacteria bacterium]|nr:hypothetical protein [Acidobacteriota bacterium]
MVDTPPLRLHAVSVVVTAAFHNPSILNPDFLVSRAIVPEDWNVAETLTTPPVAVVKYDNGIAWTVDESRLTVTEESGPEFGDTYLVHGLVDAYLEKLPHVPYRGLGLNWQVTVPQADPGRWLIERFAADWLRADPQVRALQPMFALDAGSAVCRITFTDAGGGEAACVAAECNMHHQGPFGTRDLRSAVARWPERQAFTLSALRKLLGSRPA